MEYVVISEKQAKSFAADIIFDIHKYIEEHQAEYEAFVAKELEYEVNKDFSTGLS